MFACFVFNAIIWLCLVLVWHMGSLIFIASEQRPVRRHPVSERGGGDTDSYQEWTRDRPLPLNIPEEEGLSIWVVTLRIF